MSYHYYIAEEFSPAFMALFDSVIFDEELLNAQLEDSGGFRLSVPLPVEEDIVIRDTEVVINERLVLVLSPENPLPIVFTQDVNLPTGNQSILLWMRPIAGVQAGIDSQGIFQYGNLSLSVDNVDDVDYTLTLQSGVNVNTSVHTFTEEGLAVFIVRSGDTFEVFANNVSVGSLSLPGFTVGDVVVNHNNGNAEVELDNLTITPAVLSAQERDDIYQLGRVGYITRRADSGDTIHFVSDETVVIQTEWHVVGV